MKLNLGSGAHPLDGFVNLDLADGWRFEDGLGDYPDGSVEAITISHALMYVPLASWPLVFAELARVLEPGGVVRVTEDATNDPRSSRFGGFHDALTLTSLGAVMTYMEDAALDARAIGPNSTWFRDRSLIQTNHGVPPKVFHVEGLKT